MQDRNFDDLADRFEQRIYGKLKGKIRQQVIWRDLIETIPNIEADTPLKVLDLGAGLGQFVISLAKQGHDVIYNDISEIMTQKAKAAAQKEKLEQVIHWNHAPYQTLIKQYSANTFDLILCHALLEWLSEPEKLIRTLKPLLKKDGHLSICFYNPKGLIYHNLIRGNFHYINRGSSPQSNSQGFTPNNPCNVEEVEQWLTEQELTIKTQSGIRVFSDYAREKRGGLLSEEAVLEMELSYSNQSPYWQMGRYIHLIARNH